MTRITEDWITAESSRSVMAALDGRGFFVGGCVRNALLGTPVADIDVATPLVPEDVIARLEGAGLKAIPTGLKHGTVTAVAHGETIEVTTFRTDIETDGRRAIVRYTTDISLDAGRRDFTMNALYADPAGNVIDPLGGLSDLRDRRVRFVGRPQDRIKEDYLRILRFFRFHAWYGGDGIDPDGLAACAELADGISGLAGERIGWEFRKLLAAPDPAPAVASMAASGVLLRCLPGADAACLAPMVDAETRSAQAPDWISRLAVLGGDQPASRLKLSRAERTALNRVTLALDETRSDLAAYRHGRDAACRAALIRAAATGGDPRDNWTDIERGAAAKMPLTAKDLIAEGHVPGPSLGATLNALEQRWIDSGFSLDKKTLLAHSRR